MNESHLKRAPAGNFDEVGMDDELQRNWKA